MMAIAFDGLGKGTRGKYCGRGNTMPPPPSLSLLGILWLGAPSGSLKTERSTNVVY